MAPIRDIARILHDTDDDHNTFTFCSRITKLLVPYRTPKATNEPDRPDVGQVYNTPVSMIIKLAVNLLILSNKTKYKIQVIYFHARHNNNVSLMLGMVWYSTLGNR
jgi:hypothetical protein